MSIKTDTLVLLTSSFPYVGGEQFLETEILYLSKSFKEIIIIPMSISDNKREVPSNVKVDIAYAKSTQKKRYTKLLNCHNFQFIKEIFTHLFSFRVALRTLLYGISLSEHLNKYASSHIFYSYWNGYTALALVLYMKKREGIKTLTRVHKGDLYEELHKNNYLPFQKEIYKNLTQIYSVSENGIKYIKEKYNYKQDNLILSRLGVNKREFVTATSQGEANFNIVSCANFVEEKRFDLVIDSIKKFARQSVLNIKWNHIGCGDKKEFYEKLAFENKPRNLEIFFQGCISNKNVIKFYENNALDLFINLSSSEGIPVSIMEAQSCSIPVMATNAGGTSEIVDNDNGFLLDIDFEEKEILSILNEVSLHKDIIKKKKISSLQNWDKKYNAERNYTDFIDKMKADI